MASRDRTFCQEEASQDLRHVCPCLCMLHTHMCCVMVGRCGGCEDVREGGPVGWQARAEEEGTERWERKAQEAGKGKLLATRPS